jgi:hypothetical protein
MQVNFSLIVAEFALVAWPTRIAQARRRQVNSEQVKSGQVKIRKNVLPPVRHLRYWRNGTARIAPGGRLRPAGLFVARIRQRRMMMLRSLERRVAKREAKRGMHARRRMSHDEWVLHRDKERRLAEESARANNPRPGGAPAPSAASLIDSSH